MSDTNEDPNVHIVPENVTLTKAPAVQAVAEEDEDDVEIRMGESRAVGDPTEAIIGKGTTLGYADTSGGPFTLLAEVQDCGQPELVIGSVEATHYASPDNFIEKLSGEWQDVSDIPVVLNYLPEQTVTLYSIAGVKKFWRITKPDGFSYTFPGFISKLGGGSIPNKDIIRQPATITVTGPVVPEVGSG